MSKTFEQRQSAFRNTCQNMARMIALTANFHVGSGNAEEAGKAASASARYAFHGFPELREVAP